MSGHSPLVAIFGTAAIVVSGAASYFNQKEAPERRPRSMALVPRDVDVREMRSADESAPNDVLELRGDAAVRFKIELLERGRNFLLEVPSYTAQFTKQEEVDGELLDPQVMSLKCRHNPFSVYLLWLEGDVGQEVLYVEGENRGRLLAHDGGWKARLPAFSLSPHSSLAMSESRYPITSAGILALVDMMVSVHHEDLAESRIESCAIDRNAEFDGRPCWLFTTHYKQAAATSPYRKSQTWIDREWNVPVSTQHFGWPQNGREQPADDLDQHTLIELYQFAEIDFDRALEDIDFDRKNPEYRFR